MATSTIFRIQGMKCQGCVAEIEEALEKVSELKSFQVSLDPPQLELTAGSGPVSIEETSRWLPKKFSLSDEGSAVGPGASNQTVEIGGIRPSKSEIPALAKKSVATYWPLILVISYVLIGMFIAMSISSNWQWDYGMRMFMGLFFIGFSFFKLLDLRGFADAYRGYDWVAKSIPGYGLVYPFVELTLGCCYLLGVAPLAVNLATLIVMSISIGGVIESVVKKQTIRCACLGTGFNLPMSQVTIIEDGVMIAMATMMIVILNL